MQRQAWNIGPDGGHPWTVLDDLPKPTDQMLPQQVENHFCKPICKPDSAGQAETGETQKPPEDVAQ